jgi:hypothetical protein
LFIIVKVFSGGLTVVWCGVVGEREREREREERREEKRREEKRREEKRREEKRREKKKSSYIDSKA